MLSRTVALLRCCLALLDTRNSEPLNTSAFLMPFPRLLSICFLLLLIGQSAAEQNAGPSLIAKKNSDAAVSAVSASSSQAPLTFSAVHVEGPYIAMTFDDGPNAKLTPKLLDILSEHHIKATFFVVGENAAAHPDLLQRAVREGHEIGNHSWSHPNLGKISRQNAQRELQSTADAIAAAVGIRPTLMRPPYGSLTSGEKHWIHDELGYNIILWDVDPLDWKRPGPSVVCNRIVRETRPGSIILSHDIHPGTIEAMPSTLDQLQAKGFKFVTVSELIKMGSPMSPRSSAEIKAAPANSPAAQTVETPAPIGSPSPAETPIFSGAMPSP